jgi:hypothetical protein
MAGEKLVLHENKFVLMGDRQFPRGFSFISKIRWHEKNTLRFKLSCFCLREDEAVVSQNVKPTVHIKYNNSYWQVTVQRILLAFVGCGITCWYLRFCIECEF